MKTYMIVNEHDGMVEKTVLESTRKREIEVYFNTFMRNLKKSGKYQIEKIRDGYTKYTFFGTYGLLRGEYYIVCKGSAIKGIGKSDDNIIL